MPNWSEEKAAMDALLAHQPPPKEKDKEDKKDKDKDKDEELDSNGNEASPCPVEGGWGESVVKLEAGMGMCLDVKPDETPPEDSEVKAPAKTKFDFKAFEAQKKVITKAHGFANLRSTVRSIIAVFVMHSLVQAAICLSFAFTPCDGI